jgi:hypothetical protein
MYSLWSYVHYLLFGGGPATCGPTGPAGPEGPKALDSKQVNNANTNINTNTNAITFAIHEELKWLKRISKRVHKEKFIHVAQEIFTNLNREQEKKIQEKTLDVMQRIILFRKILTPHFPDWKRTLKQIVNKDFLMKQVRGEIAKQVSIDSLPVVPVSIDERFVSVCVDISARNWNSYMISDILWMLFLSLSKYLSELLKRLTTKQENFILSEMILPLGHEIVQELLK